MRSHNIFERSIELNNLVLNVLRGIQAQLRFNGNGALDYPQGLVSRGELITRSDLNYFDFVLLMLHTYIQVTNFRRLQLPRLPTRSS
jgi:hypothetical protein